MEFENDDMRKQINFKDMVKYIVKSGMIGIDEGNSIITLHNGA